MKNTTSIKLDIVKSPTTKITSVDFDNLKFGTTFTDHMMMCDYENGAWKTPKIKPYGSIELDPSAKVFHYAQAVFEGMKAFKDENDKIWLFRPEDNFNRINISSKRMAIPEFPAEYFFPALEALLKLDQAWIKKGFGNALYLRPFVIATESGVSASPSTKYKFMIICSPVKGYYDGEVRVKFSDKFSRASDGGVGFAKAAGNYGAQFYPTALAYEEGYQQIVWTDAESHEFLEEAGTMNIFFRINDILVTAPTSDRILDGITRKSLIALAGELDIPPVDIRRISVAEIIKASEDGSLKEIFGSGTAAVITPVQGFGFKGKKYELPVITDTYAKFLKDKLMKIQYNLAEDKFGWRYEVK